MEHICINVYFLFAMTCDIVYVHNV